MTVKDLKTLIETFATAEDMTYIRGTEIEVNIDIDQVNPDKTVMIHFDQTVINTQAGAGGLVLLNVPTQLLFLRYDNELDSSLDTLDSNVELCEKDALKFYNFIVISTQIPDLTVLEPPSIERLPAFKRFDASFSGVLLNITIPILADYNCYP